MEKFEGITDDQRQTTAALAFAALGSEQRLTALRALVRAGPEGLRMGKLSQVTGIAASTLTHHLRFLTSAGLVRQQRRGRTIICAVDYDAVHALSDFLLSECCADATDSPHRHDRPRRHELSALPSVPLPSPRTEDGGQLPTGGPTTAHPADFAAQKEELDR